jgi:hypothetical protein
MKNPTEYDGVRQQSEAAFLPPSLVDVGFFTGGGCLPQPPALRQLQ